MSLKDTIHTAEAADALCLLLSHLLPHVTIRHYVPWTGAGFHYIETHSKRRPLTVTLKDTAEVANFIALAIYHHHPERPDRPPPPKTVAPSWTD